MNIVKIKDVTTQIRGVSYKPDNLSEISKDGYVELFRANNISDYGIILENTQFVEKKCVSEKQFLIENDILIAASSGSKHIVGKSSQIKYNIKNTSFGAFCKVLRPKSNINPIYLGYYFQSPNYRRIISSLSEGANINNIKNENLDNLEIPLPPLTTQKAIAEKLDKADALRKKDQKLLKHYDDLAQSIFIDMFGDPVQNEKGWEVKELIDVSSKITDGTHDTPERLTRGIKFITGKHIKPFFIDYENSDYVTEEVHKEIYKRCNPEYEDILYTNIGVNYATAAMNIASYEFSMKNVALIKYDRDIFNGRYLEYLLNDDNFKDRLKTKLGVGGAQQFLSLKQIKSIEVFLPPLNLQNQFAEKIKNIEAQKELVKKQAEASENLFQALLQESFSFT